RQVTMPADLLRHAAGQPDRHGDAAAAINLNRPLQALAVVRRQPRCSGRVVLCKLGMHGGPTALAGFFIDGGSDAWVCDRQVTDAFTQDFVIHHRTATQQGHSASCLYIFDQLQGVTSEFRSRIAFRRVADIDQVVWDLGLFFERRLGGSDIHATVDGGRIHHDDLDRPALSQRQAGGTLSRRRRAGKANHRHLHGVYWPLRNMRSSSARGHCSQVGRPWLHWSARSVCSIWRSNAFISSRVSRRLARTEPWHAIVDSNSFRCSVSRFDCPTLDRSRNTPRARDSISPRASNAGTARTAIAAGPAGVITRPSSSSVSRYSSISPRSRGSALKTTGTRSSCLGSSRVSNA